MSLEDKAEELASDLGVDKEEVRDKLENMADYNVPMDEAIQSVRREYGDGTSSGTEEIPQRDIDSISADDSAVSVTVRVLSVGKRSIQYQGERQVIYEGELADSTGKISYTAWEDFGLEAGQTLQLGNANVREWEGSPELNIGQSTTIELLEDPLEVSYEIGGDSTLAELQPGDRGRNVEVQVLECETKVIDGRDGETEILSGVFGDETARLPFTDWEPHDELREGTSVRIEDVFIREFRGVPAVNVSEFSRLQLLDEPIEVQQTAPRYSIRDAVESGGLFDVELVGNIVAVREGSGLIERCPECGRVTQGGQCRSHGEIDGVDDLRVKAILDDGTGTVTAILDDELTASIYGGGLEKAKEHARDAMDREVVADEIRTRIVGHGFCLRGSLSVDDFGANLEATTIERRDEDPAQLAQQFLEVET